MPPTHPRSLAERLSECSGSLQRTLEHARYLERIDRALARVLGAPLSESCRVANVDAGCLVLHADSPVWATRLRYRSPEILSYLNRYASSPALSSVQIKVRPRSAPSRSTPKPPTLSRSAGALLEDVADSVSHPRLQDSLRRLSRRAR